MNFLSDPIVQDNILTYQLKKQYKNLKLKKILNIQTVYSNISENKERKVFFNCQGTLKIKTHERLKENIIKKCFL